MFREAISPRLALPSILARDGVAAPWDESVHWRFTSAEIETLYEAAGEINSMAMDTLQGVVDARLFPIFGLTSEAGEAVLASWRSRDREIELATRMTLAWDGTGAPRLVSFQADSPAGLVEAAVGQWEWKQSLFPGSDQFNSIDERLGERMKAQTRLVPGVRRACVSFLADDPVGRAEMEYVAKIAEYAGFDVERIALPDIGWSDDTRLFYDMQDREIRLLFKSHPWQWLIADHFGENLMRATATERIEVVEPSWKLLLTNRAICAAMWERYSFHPNLLETVTDPAKMVVATDCLAIPKFADVGYAVREGSIQGGRFVCPDAAPEGEEGEVFQEKPPRPLGIDAVFDVWMVEGEAVGMGVRELRPEGEFFVPHRFD